MQYPEPAITGEFLEFKNYAFESVTYPYRRLTMGWKGPVARLINNQCGPSWSLRENFWAPNMVMQAVLDSALAGEERIELVNETARHAMAVYSGAGPDYDRLKLIGGKLDELQALGNVATHTYDEVTLVATDPDLTHHAALRLAKLTAGNILFVPLGQRGFVAGLQTVLQYGQLRRRQGGRGYRNNVVYPIRLSAEDTDTSHPLLHEGEFDYLHNFVKDGREVVIFSKDSDTLRRAKPFFVLQLGCSVIELSSEPYSPIIGRS